MARYSSEGARTVLVCCTGGEEGDIHNPVLREPGQPFHGLDPTEERRLLAEVRTAELAASTALIGFHRTVMLGYRDSGMAGSAANLHPECFHQADRDEATGRLVRVIREERPHVVVTYNDDHRGYPHPDHVRVHEISVLAFERAGDPTWYPSAGDPWTPSKLYYSAWSRMRIVAVHEAMLRLRGESPFDDGWLARDDLDGRITTRTPVAEWLWARSGALRAHRTQIDVSSPFWFGLSDDELAEVYPWEDWILARSTIPLEPIAEGSFETDMFRGIDVTP